MAMVRLQKILADRGVASRRKAEELIEQGAVKVNGHPVRLGDKADDRRDRITVRGKLIAGAEAPVYLMLHKPRGYITTLSDEKGRKWRIWCRTSARACFPSVDWIKIPRACCS